MHFFGISGTFSGFFCVGQIFFVNSGKQCFQTCRYGCDVHKEHWNAARSAILVFHFLFGHSKKVAFDHFAHIRDRANAVSFSLITSLSLKQVRSSVIAKTDRYLVGFLPIWWSLFKDFRFQWKENLWKTEHLENTQPYQNLVAKCSSIAQIIKMEQTWLQKRDRWKKDAVCPSGHRKHPMGNYMYRSILFCKTHMEISRQHFEPCSAESLTIVCRPWWPAWCTTPRWKTAHKDVSRKPSTRYVDTNWTRNENAIVTFQTALFVLFVFESVSRE